MNKRCWSPLIGAVLLLLQSNMAFSEWYESSGQAIVKNNNLNLHENKRHRMLSNKRCCLLEHRLIVCSNSPMDYSVMMNLK